MKFLQLLFILSIFSNISFSQSPSDQAMDKLMEGIKLVDGNKLDEAIAVFKEAQQLDTKNIDITYEIAHCYYAKGDFKTAIPFLEKIIKNQKALDHAYQLLGNSYDNEFKRDLALITYKKGLIKYPNSGPLYNEMGVLHIGKKELVKALNYFEKGIQVDPTFASNYYHAAKLYCASTNKIWGLFYGEIFMNMDRNSNRTQEISSILFNTYKQGFIFKNNKVASVYFCNDSLIIPKIKSRKKNSFGKEIFEPTLLASCKEIEAIHIENLHKIRYLFLQKYQENFLATYPNILFEYQLQMIKAHVFESYNYWLLNKGNESEFKAWATENTKAFSIFLKWYKEHPLVIDEAHKMHRVDY